MYIYTPNVSSAQGGQKRMLNPLELESQTVVNHHVVLGTEPVRTASALNCWSISPVLQMYRYFYVAASISLHRSQWALVAHGKTRHGDKKWLECPFGEQVETRFEPRPSNIYSFHKSPFWIFLYLFTLFGYVPGVRELICQGVQVEVRGQSVGVWSLLLLFVLGITFKPPGLAEGIFPQWAILLALQCYF